MPRGDKTGPNGTGPMTGRGMGHCAGYEAPGFTSDVPVRGGAGYGRGFGSQNRGGMGFGHGRGRSFGRGWGYRNFPVPGFEVGPNYDSGDRRSDLADELASLKEQLKVLEERLAGSSGKD